MPVSLADNSQGGVQVPTGGDSPRALNRKLFKRLRSSRFGEIPKPTVTVWIKESCL